MPRDLTESQVERAVAGESEDVEALALSFLPRIYGLTLRLTRRADLAEEATQETYLRLLRALPSLRNPARVDSWVLTIAGNVTRDAMRRRGKEQALTYDPPAIDPDDGFDRARKRAIDLALGELPYKDRELFLLHAVEGVKLAILARARKESLSSVTSRVHRVRTKVRIKAMARLKAAGAVS